MSILRLCIVTVSLCGFMPLISSCAMMKSTARSVAKTFRIIDDPGEIPAPSRPPEMPEEYREALVLLQERRFQSALEILDRYLLQEPTAPYTQAALLNSGRALEGLERWSEAAERYRRVSIACDKVAPKLQAMALYRLSFTHEALGEDQQVVAVLHDLLSRQENLPKEIARAELPARLAGAYARVGNFNKAMDLYKIAEAGVSRLRQSDEKVPDWLPKTLYFMGSMALRHVTWNDFETALRPFSRSQSYLLQSAEFGAAPWSERAASDLVGAYRDLWNVIENAPFSEDADPVLARRETQRQQWDRAALLLDHLLDLRARMIPDKADVPPTAQKVAGFIDDLEKRLRHLLAERPVGEGSTREAVERRRGVRGKVVDPDDGLERQFLESARKAGK